MYTNVNLAAPLGALALLGTGFLLALSLLGLILSFFVRKPGRTKIALSVIVVISGVYLAALLAFSLISHEKLLARGEEKHFCELDCHLAYSIVDARQVRTLGEPPNQALSSGSYAVVTIKTRFDETTISPTRGNGQLFPNSRVLTLIDDHGARYAPW